MLRSSDEFCEMLENKCSKFHPSAASESRNIMEHQNLEKCGVRRKIVCATVRDTDDADVRCED